VCVCSLSYPARKPHAPYYIIIYGLSVYIILSHITKKARFPGKNFIEHKWYVLILFTTIV